MDIELCIYYNIVTIWFLFMIQSVNLPPSAHTITSSAHCITLQPSAAYSQTSSAHPVHTAAHCNPLQPTAIHPVHIQCTHCSSHYIFSAHTTAAITSSVHTAAMYSHVQLSAANLQCTLQPCTAICSQYSVHTAANCSHLQPPILQLYHSVRTAATLSDANTIQCI